MIRPGGRSARVRAAVLDAVAAELVEHGFDGLTIDGVASRAGVHRTSVYRRWTDVGGLLADVLDAAAEDAWVAPDAGSLDGDLVALVRELHAGLTVGPPITPAIIAASFRSPEAAAALRRFWAGRYARCATVVEQAVRRGEIGADVDAEALLVAATGPVYHHLVLLHDGATLERMEFYARAAAAAARAGAFCREAA